MTLQASVRGAVSHLQSTETALKRSYAMIKTCAEEHDAAAVLAECPSLRLTIGKVSSVMTSLNSLISEARTNQERYFNLLHATQSPRMIINFPSMVTFALITYFN